MKGNTMKYEAIHLKYHWFGKSRTFEYPRLTKCSLVDPGFPAQEGANVIFLPNVPKKRIPRIVRKN